MTVLALLMVLIFSVTTRVAQLWKETSGAIGQWQAARLGFEAMTRRISQATLNTTWAYFDGPGGTGNLTSSDPKSYGRYTELHFVSGPAANILSSINATTTQAIFFQAPLGNTREKNLLGLPNLLNSCGFFIQFNSDADFRPNLSIFQNVLQKRRFRLMGLVDPSENPGVYSSPGATNFDWFLKPIQEGRALPLAENIVALIILPKFSRFDTISGSVLAPLYSYNSRISFNFNSSGVKGNTLHQLPPLLQVAMVAIDETSAQRLEKEFGQAMPQIFTDAPFSNAIDFDKDLAQLERNLLAKKLTYRIFTSVISIRGAKWSGDLP